MAKKLVIPATPTVDGAAAPVARAFEAAIRKHATVESIDDAATGLGKLLAKDAKATQAVHAAIASLAHALAPIDGMAIKDKPKRLAFLERIGQLEMLASCLRRSDEANDAALVELVLALPDGHVVVVLVGVLTGGQISLPLCRDARLAALLETSTQAPVLRAALAVLFATQPEKGSELARQVLTAASTRDGKVLTAARTGNVKLVPAVLAHIAHHEREHVAWLPLVAPLTLHASADVANDAASLVAKQPAMFTAYVAWALEQDDVSGVIGVITSQLYWAQLVDPGLPSRLVSSFTMLRDRARKVKNGEAVAAIEAVLRKVAPSPSPSPTTTTTSRTTRTRGAAPVVARLAHVGTEGGPPLLVPAELLSAWQGAMGPEPFDSGKSDYERATRRPGPQMIRIGAGQGVVLDEQSVDVHAERTGLLLVASGSPDEALETAWKKLGALTVGAEGIVVLDAAEAGSARGVNRSAVPLEAGTYEVLTHLPQGFGGDYSATRLVKR